MHKAWTPAEDEILERHYPCEGSHRLTSRLKGRSASAIRNRAHDLGVRIGFGVTTVRLCDLTTQLAEEGINTSVRRLRMLADQLKIPVKRYVQVLAICERQQDQLLNAARASSPARIVPKGLHVHPLTDVPKRLGVSSRRLLLARQGEGCPHLVAAVKKLRIYRDADSIRLMVEAWSLHDAERLLRDLTAAHNRSTLDNRRNTQWKQRTTSGTASNSNSTLGKTACLGPLKKSASISRKATTLRVRLMSA